MTRLAGGLAVFAAVTGLVAALLFRGVDALGVGPVEVALDAAFVVEAGLVPLREGAGDGAWDVGFLGDSMLVGYPPKRRVPVRLQQAVDVLMGPGEADRVRIYSLATPGLGPFDYYFLAERVAGASPDQAILPVNLASFSDGWRAAFARPALAGWIPPSRLPEAFGLPLDRIGLTADRLLSYVAVVQAGAARPWKALMVEQARTGRARERVRARVGESVGSEARASFDRASLAFHEARVMLPGNERLSFTGVRERYGRALDGLGPDDPSLRMLAATIRVLREGGAEVLVYTSPANVEHVAAVGAANPAGLDRTLAAVAAVARENGARFVDLHDLLPDAGFRDPGGHLSIAGEIDGPMVLARHLAPTIVTARVGRD